MFVCVLVSVLVKTVVVCFVFELLCDVVWFGIVALLVCLCVV